MPEVLQIENLQIGYQNGSQIISVSSNLNASLSKGELACILGPNGIGKSTFIKTIAGMQKPISGTVKVNEINIHDIPNNERANHLSVVLTGRPSYNLVTVRELVELGRYAHTNWKHSMLKEDKRIVDEAIEAVGLEADSVKLVTELSDGNAQKAMIACTLAQNADLILLDEPTVHLDISNKAMILELLIDLTKNHKKSILLSSHDLNMMSQIADKLWLFKSDEIIAGTPEDLIISGKVDEILGSEELKLDHLRKDNLHVALVGQEDKIYWVARALKRKGYEIDPQSKVIIKADKEIYELVNSNNKLTFHSIEETLNGLDELNNEYRSI